MLLWNWGEMYTIGSQDQVWTVSSAALGFSLAFRRSGATFTPLQFPCIQPCTCGSGKPNVCTLFPRVLPSGNSQG